MTLAQAQNLSDTLLAQGCTVHTTLDPFQNTYIVRATKPGSKVTSVRMTNLVTAIVPSVPVVTAQTDRAEFV